MTINDLRIGHLYKHDGGEIFVHEVAANYVVYEFLDPESVEFRHSLGRGAKAKVYKASHQDDGYELMR